MASAERGVNTTVTVAMSAAGQFMAPFFIFQRLRMNDGLKVGAPPESAFTCNASGWSTFETFGQTFDHFLKFARPTAEDPVLLILDGHTSHTKNLEVLEKAKINHVHIISIPPHTSHKSQPLDVSFMGPLKTYYGKALNRCMKRLNGNPITAYHVAGLVNDAFTAAATVIVAQNGFRKTGIYPFNRQVFPESDYAPADFLVQSVDQNAAESSVSTGLACAPLEGSSSDPQQLTGMSKNHSVYLKITVIKQTLAFVTASTIVSQNVINVSDVVTLDADSTFYFVDDNGIVTSLIVQENYQDYSFLTTCADVQDDTHSSGNLVHTSMDANEGLTTDEPIPTIEPSIIDRPTDHRIIEPSNEDQENIAPSAIATPLNLKRRRWDRGFPKSQNKSSTFVLPPRMTDLDPDVQIQREKKRKAGNRKQECAELTSSEYRKELKQAQALKDIKNIKKKPTRKRKSKGDDKLEDALCPTCGSAFSSSLNGVGWKRCIKCTEWFHIDCQGSTADSVTCYICI